MTNSLETIDENNFIINFNDGYNDYSGPFDKFGCKWTLVNNYTGTASNFMTFYLKCTANNSNLWNINAQLTSTLIKKDGTKVAQKSQHAIINFQRTKHEIAKIRTQAELNQYLVASKLTIECRVKILSITGLPKRITVNLLEEDNKTKDVALIVEGKKLYASKTVLATFSPVFRAMFFSGFKESTDKEVVINDVGFKEFEQFLQVIYAPYPNINKNNIKSILELADRYDVPIVMEKCENYMLIADDIDIGLKLGLAETYTLAKLYEKSINSINTSTQVRTVLQNNDELGIMAMKHLSLKATAYFH